MYYDYECSQCGIFEVKQSIKDEPLTICPKCGEGIRKLVVMPPRPIWKGRFKWMKFNPEVKERDL